MPLLLPLPAESLPRDCLQDITVAATLDCILASLEQSDDGAPGETAASGGIVHENVDESKSAQGTDNDAGKAKNTHLWVRSCVEQ